VKSAGRFPRAAVALLAACALWSSACDGDDTTIGGPTSGTSPAGGSDPASSASVPPGDDATVGIVVDGDTLRTNDDERVRLLNIDTPEPTQRECWADEATARLESLLPPGTEIRLVYDQERFDRYGRTLAHVYRLDDGVWVNRQLALDGAAYPYVLKPNDMRYETIRSAADEARAAHRGLWGACDIANRLRGGSTTTVTGALSNSTPPSADRAGCDAAYPTVCIPPSPPDLDCGDIAHRRFTVLPPDPHRFDGGGNGIGCENG
jgi:micrococcal nuclease